MFRQIQLLILLHKNKKKIKNIKHSRKSKGFLPHRCTRLLSLLFLSFFVFSSTLEAKHHSSSRRASTVRKKARETAPRNRQKARISKSSQRLSRTGTRPQHISRGRGRPQRTPNIRQQTPKIVSGTINQPPAQTSCNIQQLLSILATPLPPAPVNQPIVVIPPAPVNRPVAIIPPAPVNRPVADIPPAPVNLPIAVIPNLPPSSEVYTKRIAQMMGLDKLPINPHGPEITVAIVEQSGTWKPLPDAIHNPQSLLSPETREHYRRNFLTPIGDPQGRLHPEEQNDEIRLTDKGDYHGAYVAAVLLDHRAKVRPVSTFNTTGLPDRYDVADALMDLVQKPNVNIINISAGYIHANAAVQAVRDENGLLLHYMTKTVYTPKLVEALKALADAGKVIVWAAGNNGNDIQSPQYKRSNTGEPCSQIMGHLIEALDRKTRKSIIIAGGYDPDTGNAIDYSNKPGNWPEAQERFLFAPCRHSPAYLDYKIGETTCGATVGGTSIAAPAICAAIAKLCEAIPGLPPKKAMKALLKTADQRPEKHIYGCGLVRADKAFEELKELYQ